MDEAVAESERALDTLRSSPPGEHSQALYDYLKNNPTERFRRLVAEVLPDSASTEECSKVVRDLAIELLCPGREDLRRLDEASRSLSASGIGLSEPASVHTAGDVDRATELILQSGAMAAMGWPQAGIRSGAGRWWGGYYLVAAYLTMFARSTLRAFSQPEWYLTDALRGRTEALLRRPPSESARVETWALSLAASLVFLGRCGCGLHADEGRGHGADACRCCRPDHVVSRWRPGEKGEPPTVHGWLARYVRGPMAPTVEGAERGPEGFSPSGLRYSAIYGSLLDPEVGLRIDTVLMRHCPSCDRWLRAKEIACPGDPAHRFGWRLRQHRMLDAHEDSLISRLEPRATVNGNLRWEGRGTDGVVVSSRRLRRCGRKSCDYYVLDPDAPCPVCDAPPPHGRESSYAALGPLPVDLDSVGVEPDGAAAPSAALGLRLDCERLIHDKSLRPPILRCLAFAMHAWLVEGEADADGSGNSRQIVKALADRLPTRMEPTELEHWVRRLQGLLGYRPGGYGEVEEEGDGHA
jgi:hypothetical protein